MTHQPFLTLVILFFSVNHFSLQDKNNWFPAWTPHVVASCSIDKGSSTNASHTGVLNKVLLPRHGKCVGRYLVDMPIDMECWLDIVDDLPEELWASEPRTRASQVTNAWGFSLRVEVVQLFLGFGLTCSSANLEEVHG